MNRDELSQRLSRRLDLPMAVLAVLMLFVVVIDLLLDLPPQQQRWLDWAGWLLWSVFALEYVVKLMLASDRRLFIQRHWFDALVVLLPMFRTVQALRILGVAQAYPLFELVTYIGKGTTGLRVFFTEHRIGYLIGLTGVITFAGASGVFLFERDAPGTPYHNFGDALWWSAAMMTSIGAEMAPVTVGGRLVALAMMGYAMVVVVYLIGAVSSYLLRSREQREAGQELEAGSFHVTWADAPELTQAGEPLDPGRRSPR